jgi:hypothetical protein
MMAEEEAVEEIEGEEDAEGEEGAEGQGTEAEQTDGEGTAGAS